MRAAKVNKIHIEEDINVTVCHHLRKKRSYLILIVWKEKEGKEQVTCQRGNESKSNKREREREREIERERERGGW